MSATLRMLKWSLSLDRQFFFAVGGLPLSAKLSLLFHKYLRYLAGRLGVGGGRAKSLMVFGRRFCYNEPLAVASLQRVYCAAHGLKDLLPERPVVLDVGANIGQFNFFSSHYLAARRVISIEPDPGSFELLAVNALRSSDCRRCAVSDQEGEVLFHVACESTQLSSYLPQPDAGYRDSYPVPARTLDGIAEELGVGEIDLLKIDTEGSEYDVLKSAEEVLSRTRLVLIEMSVFRECSGNLFRIGSFLEERGFRLVHLAAGEEGRPRDLDALFQRA
ncbi:FkbM family methyltransferase [Geomonas sp. Red69]|uniref:FkbM family methyltransferase n=1 Tax=Geomonas diazotrophica TaxID=2843197 RepID=UPI001C0F41BE|nr:FkbM family methyltransferase [Geomonas diazotrophica]MBU5636466.1 FkbM family methyltransferase [Geomonas diazotrophica]